ncbi:hypothetical protein [Streptomyces sp. NPDC127112]|uniref:hypothetical protein n=1 Tax=Streptomyces sp. NPDC127112 TaxID=3345364 RepID=UPI003643CD6F
MGWLLAHDKIGVPTGPTVGSLVVDSGGQDRYATRRFRLDDPHLTLAGDVPGEDGLSGRSTNEDADALAELTGRRFGATVLRLTAPLVVMARVRLVDRFRSGSGGLRLTLAWPARLRGAVSERRAGGVLQHGRTYAAPGEKCVCRRFDCGGSNRWPGAPTTATR